MRGNEGKAAAARSRRSPAGADMIERVVIGCIGGMAVASVVAVIVCSTIGLTL